MAAFGWCIDNTHESCKKEFMQGDKAVVCACSCHGENVPRRPRKTKVASESTDTVKGSQKGTQSVSVVYNKDGSVRKKRGRPKGSKNKPKDK